ncbi:538_t:CDS:2 [Dentiscutata heterogama]|uniref:538_t:CDS:1 n=1 Tax=Dentiscutata heterogama TaxID=1316150 RepID=A0ACA9JZP7_9GLOM|nr:538_t:CDS:2 [Dentiscutata heterogama]
MDGSKCTFNVQEEVNNIKRESEDEIQKEIFGLQLEPVEKG